MNLSQQVTCEEHIKALEKARLVIISAYTLEVPNELSLIRYKISLDIEQCIKHYKKHLENNKQK